MKFTLHLPPQHLDLLNLRAKIRAKGCPHCQCQSSIKSHGYLKGLPANGSGEINRGVRFFAPIAIQTKVVVEPSPFTGTAYFLTAWCVPDSYPNYY